MPTTYELLYLSALAPATPVTEMAQIAAHARRYNQQHGITGLLVFDGQRFCQHIEGDKETVLALFRRIRNDPRHADIEVQHQGATAERRFKRFATGYAPGDGDHMMAAIEEAVGEQAVRTLLAQLPELDLDS